MEYKYKPKTKEELIEVIKKEIFEIQGTKNNPNWKADLNCIDTSNITDMSELFSRKFFYKYRLSEFNGNINKWNVSNVQDMNRMFVFSKFNGDISNWDVSNVKNMAAMFYHSEFNQDISNWDVSNVTDMSWMFYSSQFNQNISNWDVSNVKDMSHMFENSRFNGDISNWNVSNVEDMESMFKGSKFNGNISNWNVGNVKDMSYMFKNSNFNRYISNWNISNVKDMRNMFFNSQFNQDIGSWPEYLKKQTGLKNISASPEYNKLPDKIIFPETVQNILQNKNILYEPETIAKLFVYSLENNNKNFNFKSFFKDYLKEKKEYYQNKGYKFEIINKLILNNMANILKYLKNKDMQEKFMKFIKITINKNKEPNIDIVS